MAASWFVTATDTGAGKTHLTALLARTMRASGLSPVVLKPVVCGRENGRFRDQDILARAADVARPESISRYRFAPALSPDQAAAAEGRHIDPDALVAWCRRRANGASPLLIEGVGGLMVPLAPGFRVLEWVRALPELRPLVVVGARLGAINHALLTLETLESAGRRAGAVVVNAPRPAADDWLTPVARGIRPWLDQRTPLFTIAHGGRFAGEALSRLIEDLCRGGWRRPETADGAKGDRTAEERRP